MIFQRLNYLDSLRAFAMYLGIVLHSTIPFLPWYGDYEEKDGYGILVLLIHGFRMPLFMIISGFFAEMIINKSLSLNGILNRYEYKDIENHLKRSKFENYDLIYKNLFFECYLAVKS